MIHHVRISLFALCLGLTACTSAPVQYYTLMAPPAETSPQAAPGAFLIDVLPVGLPEQLDQPQLVVREAESGAVAILDGQRWAGPLGEELRRALSARLSERLTTQDIAGLATPAGARVLRVKLQIRRLDAWPERKVQLEAGWSLSVAQEPGGAALVCQGRFQESAPGGYPALVQAMQRTIDALSERIASDARLRSVSPQAQCSDGAKSVRGDL